MKIHMNPNRRKSKPLDQEVPKEYAVTYNNMVDWDIETIATEVGQYGRSFIPALLSGGKKAGDFQSMQLFALDFDNKGETKITYDDIYNRALYYGIPILFAYETFNSTEGLQKFRIVLCHEFPITVKEIAEILIGMLLKIFPEADVNCKNLNRMFFGGKNLLCLNSDVHFHMVHTLLLPFYNVLDNNHHLKRNIIQFAKNYDIAVLNDRLCLWSENKKSEIGEIMPNDIYNNISSGINSPFFELFCGDVKVRGCTKNHVRQLKVEKSNDQRNRVSLNDGKCKLYDDFIKGEKLEHNQRFLILTNICKIENGFTLFMDTMEKYYPEDSVSKWMKYTYVNAYNPKSCSPEDCPYYYNCHAGNCKNILQYLKVSSSIRYDASGIKYSPLEDVRQNLENNLTKAINEPGNKIHLIKAQTGVGKTTQILKYIKDNPKEKILLAVPTNKIKAEVEEKLYKSKVSVFVTPSVSDNYKFPEEIREEVMNMHSMGIHNMTKRIISEYEESEDKAHIGIIEECEKVKAGSYGYQGEQVFLTTHAYYMNLDPSIINKFTVIIDEDILVSAILNNIKSVSKYSIEQIKQSSNGAYSNIANIMLGSAPNKYHSIEAQPNLFPFTKKQLDEMGVYENVNDLKYARSYIREKTNNSDDFYYFAPPILPNNKTIILSATYNENVYKQYFNKDIVTYPELIAEYKGELIQYTYYSLGRSSLKTKIDKIQRFINDKLKITESQNIISFKNSTLSESLLHYGNAIGVNDYEGKDIVIVGTPFDDEKCCKLVAAALGENQLHKDKCHNLRVSYNGYEFSIMTYNNKVLREIQLYYIESNIEQCVGRARLLSNECTVYLLSCFPAEQAQLIKYDYLKAID